MYAICYKAPLSRKWKLLIYTYKTRALAEADIPLMCDSAWKTQIVYFHLEDI